MTTEEQINKLIEVLNLKRKKEKGKTIYLTLWGTKTEIGVRETIKNILELK